MPKIKTNRAAAKRFRVTGGGRIKRSKAYHSHLLLHKSSKRKRNLRKNKIVDSANYKSIKRLLPMI